MTRTAKGTRQKATKLKEVPGGENGFSLISNGKLIELYAAMVKSRMVVERAGFLKQKGALAGDLDGGRGREAAIAGVGVDLLADDTLSPSRCDLVSSVIKGMALHRMFSRLASPENDHARTPEKVQFDEEVNVMIPDLNLDAKFDAAREAAAAHKAAKNGRIVVVTCGDGAPGIGCWSKALTHAGDHELPMIFVWHNDAGEAREPLVGHDGIASRTPDRSLPAITVDGGDAVAVYRVASESIQRARRLRGPTLIECRCEVSARFVGQANGKRPESKDPIDTMETYLIGKGLFSAEMKRNIAKEFDRELDAATRFLDR